MANRGWREIAEVSKDRPTWAIGIMMVFAFVVTLCSEADAFVAANFTTLRPAAKLAFLVLGLGAYMLLRPSR